MSCKNLKISEMPIVKKLQASDILPIVQDGKNYTISIKQLLQLFPSDQTDCSNTKYDCILKQLNNKIEKLDDNILLNNDKVNTLNNKLLTALDTIKDSTNDLVGHEERLQTLEHSNLTSDVRLDLIEKSIKNSSTTSTLSVVTNTDNGLTTYKLYQGGVTVNNENIDGQLVGVIQAVTTKKDIITDVTLTKKNSPADAEAVGQQLELLSNKIKSATLGGSNLETTLEQILGAIGSIDEHNHYIPQANSNYISQATSMSQVDSILDDQLGKVNTKVTALQSGRVNFTSGTFTNNITYDNTNNVTVNIPTKTSQILNDSEFINQTQLTNAIQTLNNAVQSLTNKLQELKQQNDAAIESLREYINETNKANE